MKPTIIAVGASTRGLVQSIRKAGYDVVALDQFVDRDTRQLASRTFAFSEWPALRERIPQLVAQFQTPGCPIVVVGAGGVEHCRELFLPSPNGEAIPWMTERGEAIARLRDPAAWTDRLRLAKCPVAEVSVGGCVVPQSEHAWFQKPLASGGGLGVLRVSPGQPFDSNRNWLQEYADGDVFGATCLAGAKGVQIVGVCRHLQSESEPASPIWAGAVGPLATEALPMGGLHRAVSELAAWSGIRGWFGVDFTVGAPGTRFEDLPIVLEINPRYTASMELVDEESTASLFAAHSACLRKVVDAKEATQRSAVAVSSKSHSFRHHRVFAKRILYNQEDAVITVSSQLSDWMWTRHCQIGQPLRDVPVAGYRAEPQAPICTVFAAGACEASALDALEIQHMETRKAITRLAT